MTYYTHKARCPHCNAWTDHSVQRGVPDLVGNPYRRCFKCQKDYWDFSYQEDAIYYFLKNSTCVSWIYALPVLFAAGASAFFIIIGIIGAIYWISVFGVILFLIFFFPAKKVITDIIGLFNEEKFKQTATQKIDTRFKEEENNDSLLGASLRRLSDSNYLEFLTDNLVEVPDYFFERIGYVPKISPKEKKRIKEEEMNEDLEALKREQVKFVRASHFLSKGVNNKDFKAVANKLGMTPSEFKEYCQKVVKDYEAMHIEYNKTHATPAQFPEVYN